jgi:putative sigma-54 modulation protein
MTVEEAAMRIDGSPEDFVVFRDSGSEKVSVLYKRRDGDYALIVPEW